MKKKFIMTLPDQPYKDTIADDIEVQCTYDGPRYLLVAVDDRTDQPEYGTVKFVARKTENVSELDLKDYNEGQHDEEGITFVILDAAENTWEAAYLTHSYTHETIPDYHEVLPTKNDAGEDETYTYHYDDTTGGIGACTYQGMLRYNFDTQTYARPPYRLHALTRQSFLDSLKVMEQQIKDRLLAEASILDQDAKDELNDYLDWLTNIPVKYANVDHWKIPFRSYPQV